MSFFDEVETTVANTRFLQAVEENAPVNLKLTPYEELGAFEEKFRLKVTIPYLLRTKTSGRYQFLKYLRGDKDPRNHVVADLLDDLEAYERFPKEDILARATEIFNHYFPWRLNRHSQNASQAGGTPQAELEQGEETGLRCPDSEPTAEDAHENELSAFGSHQQLAVVEHGDAMEEQETENSLDHEEAKETRHGDEDRSVQAAVDGNALRSLFENHADALTQVEERMAHHVPRTLHRIFHPALKALMNIVEALVPGFIGSDIYKQYIQVQHYGRQPVKLADFRVFRVLGRGAFGAVSAVQKIDTHAIYAMKEMGKKQIKQNQSEWMVLNEKKVLSRMRSPFVLNLKYSFHTQESAYLIFDMCSGGDLKFHLRSLMSRERNFPSERALFYGAEVLLGLEHIHSFDMVYRDLKPTNILLDTQGHVMISDLGLQTKLRKGKILRHLAGTAGYWAPEIVTKTGTYKASDYWSFGVFLYEMISGRRPMCVCTRKTSEWCPFGQKRIMEENALREDGVLRMELEFGPLFSPEAVDLLQKLFEVDPAKRLGAGGAEEIKAHPYFASIDWVRLAAKAVTPPFVPDSRTVNAHSIGEVGEFNKGKFRKVKITDEDEKYYKDFNYISMDAVENELVSALDKMDNPPDPHEYGDHGYEGGCCALL